MLITWSLFLDSLYKRKLLWGVGGRGEGDQFRLCSLNAQSLRNKSADFLYYASTTGVDIIAVTET